MARLEFFGVRGSHPTPTESNLKFGGNTSCVVLYSDSDPAGEFPIIFDLGTGLSSFANTQALDGSFHGVSLLSHMHFDHIQGLPFFSPVDRTGARLVVYGPGENGAKLQGYFDTLFSPPYFPVTISQLNGEISFISLETGLLHLDQPGNPKVIVDLVDHTNVAYGYRVELDGKVVTYVPDHQAPPDQESVSESLERLCFGADLLIHDAQYTKDEFSRKGHWGHSTFDYALAVALKSQVKSLAFFHHDPARTDEDLTKIEQECRDQVAMFNVDVFASREGQKILL